MPEQALTIPWGVDVAAEVADVLGVGDLVYVGRVPRCVRRDILAQQPPGGPKSCAFDAQSSRPRGSASLRRV